MQKFLRLLFISGLIFPLCTYGKGQGKELKIWAYSGPLSYLSGAKVTIRDSMGFVVGSGVTGKRGTASILTHYRRSSGFPLIVRTTGGKAGGRRFNGHLTSVISNDSNLDGIHYVDLISSAATKLGHISEYQSYFAKVREALGIEKGAPEDFLRVLNKHVDADLLKNEIATAGSFDKYVKRIVSRVGSGGSVKELKLDNWFEANKKKANSVGAKVAKQRINRLGEGLNRISGSTMAPRQAQSSPSGSPICAVPLPNGSPGSGTSGSDQVIQNFGVVGLQILLKAAGVPSQSNNILTGMLLSAIGQNSSPTTEPTLTAITAVQAELDCISAQIGYLQTEFQALEFQSSLTPALNCQNAVQQNWSQYQFFVNNSDNVPLNSNNSSLQSQLPLWNELNNVCGSSINNSLFGNAGGQSSAWELLNQSIQIQTNQSLQGQGSFYGMVDNQKLQVFMSYWSTIAYQQFVLTNEYYNFNALYESAAAASGASQPASVNSNGITYCIPGTGSVFNYCLYANNMQSLYPPDLYSDEIAILSNGIAVVPAVPGIPLNSSGQVSISGLQAFSTLAQLQQLWSLMQIDNKFANQTANWTTSNSFNISGAVLFSAAANVWSGNINSAAVASGSTVEWFTNPLVAHNLMLSDAQQQAVPLYGLGPTGLTAQEYFQEFLTSGITYSVDNEIPYLPNLCQAFSIFGLCNWGNPNILAIYSDSAVENITLNCNNYYLNNGSNSWLNSSCAALPSISQLGILTPHNSSGISASISQVIQNIQNQVSISTSSSNVVSSALATSNPYYSIIALLGRSWSSTSNTTTPPPPPIATAN